jgi:hypothetical protein
MPISPKSRHFIATAQMTIFAVAFLFPNGGLAQEAPAAKETEAAKAVDAEAAQDTEEGAADLVTQPIVVKGDKPGALGNGDVGGIGTTNLDNDGFTSRTDGSGDANSFLRSMPNVQYRDDTDTDPGESTEDVINLRPGLFSISGGRVYENNFMLDGVGINTISGTVERTGVTPELDYGNGVPNADLVYGLHPQTIFIPSSLVDSVTVHDSDISAEYGGFQGGVVNYKLSSPPRDRYKGSVDYSYQDDSFVHYKVSTIDGTNPLDRQHPEFTKHNLAVSLGGPINDKVAWLAGVSRQTADTRKQRIYELKSGWISQETENLFASASVVFDTSIGDFTLQASMTDYEQDWESPAYYQMELDTKTKSIATQFRHDADLPDLRLGKIWMSGIKVKSSVFYNDSSVENRSNSNVLFSYYMRHNANGGFLSTELDDWCQDNPTAGNNSFCRIGGYGDKTQDQTDYGVKSNLTGTLLDGTLRAGIEVKNVDVRRTRPEDFTYYTTTYTTAQRGVAAFNCLDPDDVACSPEQFHRIKSVFVAFDNSVNVGMSNAFVEYLHDWDYFSIRTGLRFDHETYLGNANFAPRVTATIRPLPGVSLSGGFNRYYSADALQFAIRDAQPRGQSYSRTNDGADVDNSWTMLSATGSYGYADSGLRTPFTDEFTAGITWKEPYLNGMFRLRYIDRQGKDQIAKAQSGTTALQPLTNNGRSEYRSLTGEYEKWWSGTAIRHLDEIGLRLAATWAKRNISNENYFWDDGTGDYIWYNDASYTLAGFDQVLGNLDIPVRTTVELNSYWFDGRLRLSSATDINMPYTGVYDTGANITVPVDGIPRSHDIYADRRLGITMNTDAKAEFSLHRWSEDGGVKLIARVDNLFDRTGNAVASYNNPFIRGRSFWLGLQAAF